MYRLFFYAIVFWLLWFMPSKTTKNIPPASLHWAKHYPYQFCTDTAPFKVPPEFPPKSVFPNTCKVSMCFMPVNKLYSLKIQNAPIVKTEVPPLVISIKHVKNIESCSRATASRRIRVVWDSLGKQKHQRITVEEYAGYYGYAIDDILIRIS